MEDYALCAVGLRYLLEGGPRDVEKIVGQVRSLEDRSERVVSNEESSDRCHLTS